MIAPIGMAMSFKIAPPDKRGSIMGLLGLPMLIAPVLGPVLSGWLLEYASWHWIFLINVPIGIIAMIVGVKFLPVIEKGNKAKLDIWGVILSPLAFSSLVFGVHRGEWTAGGSYNDYNSCVQLHCFSLVYFRGIAPKRTVIGTSLFSISRI